MIKYRGNNTSVICAVESANELILNNEFLSRIASIDSFDMANCSGREIVSLIEMFIRKAFGDLEVVVYKSKNPWSKAYGYFNPAQPNKIYLNSRKLNRSVASIVASLVHELIHYLDSNSDFSFGHKDNNPIGKENTAPYLIDALAESMMPMSHNEGGYAYKIYTPWYYRVFNFLKWW